MNLYRDGQFIEVYKQPRDIEPLREYVASHAEPKASSNKQSAANVKLVDTADESEVHNPDGTVMILNSSNFDKAIQDGHVFIKFFAPWFVAFACLGVTR